MAPTTIRGRLSLARVLSRAGRLAEARAEYREAIRLGEEQGAYNGQFIYRARRELAKLDDAASDTLGGT
jgi:hypothetical protein